MIDNPMVRPERVPPETRRKVYEFIAERRRQQMDQARKENEHESSRETSGESRGKTAEDVR